MDPSMMPTRDGTTIMGSTAPLVQIHPGRRRIGDGEQELARGHRYLERSAHHEVQHRHVRPSRAQAEHAGHDADDDEQRQAAGRLVDVLLTSLPRDSSR